MDRGAWWVTVHGVTQSRTRLKPLSTHTVYYLTAFPGAASCSVMPAILLSHFFPLEATSLLELAVLSLSLLP